MVKYKKILRSLLFIVLFFSIINSNLFGKCCNYSKKGNNNDNNNTTSTDNNIDSKKDDNNPDPNKDNPPQENPPQSDNIEQLYQNFHNLFQYVFVNYGKINSAERLNIDVIKNQVEKNRNDINILKQNINLLESEKNKIDVIIKEEEEKKNKKPDADPGKDPNKDNNEITEIQTIDLSKIPEQNIEEKYDTTGININFINEGNFKFKYSKNDHVNETKLDKDMFNKLDDLIKNFLAKKKLTGNFIIDYIDPGHAGVNPILKIKITDNGSKTFNAFIKNEHIEDYMLFMFKGFQILDLLPFEYYIDLKNYLMITEDVVEKGFSFLDNDYEKITENNKKMWRDCKNMNEFRFWCYLLVCDDIDPMYKFDNCCFKDNKVHALDIRINRKVNYNLGNYRIEDDIYKQNYDIFMQHCFSEINSNDIPEEYKKNSDHYKIWKKSIDDFKDFSDDEKNSINEKLIKLLNYFIGICKHYKWEYKMENMDQTKYIKQVIRNIMNFLQYYISQYKKKYTKFEYNGETLENQYNGARYNVDGCSYGKANGIFKKLIDENKLDFEYFLTSENLVKLYNIHQHIPFSSEVHYALPNINFGI